MVECEFVLVTPKAFRSLFTRFNDFDDLEVYCRETIAICETEYPAYSFAIMNVRETV